MSKQYPTEQFVRVVKCELCDAQDDVNWFCKNCIKNLCDSCKKMHIKIPSLSSHNIGTVGDGWRVDRNAKMLCEEHGELIQYKCTTCSNDICVRCAVDKHRQHELIDMKKEDEEKMVNFRLFLESKTESLARIKETKKSVEDRKHKLKTNADKSKQDIITCFDKILEYRETMLKKVETNYQYYASLCDSVVPELLQQESELESKIQQYSRGLDCLTGVSLSMFIEKAKGELGPDKRRSVTVPPPSSTVVRLDRQDMSNISDALKPISEFFFSQVEERQEYIARPKLQNKIFF